jgi:hypothetical protein
MKPKPKRKLPRAPLAPPTKPFKVRKDNPHRKRKHKGRDEAQNGV